MLLHLQPLFMGEKSSIPVDCTLDFSQLEWQGQHPFSGPVRVQGEVRAAADMVVLRATVFFRFESACDRCAEPLSRDMKTEMEHTLVTSLNDEENDELVLVDKYCLALDELVQTDVLLNLPSKNLCREDCRGLCPMCGKNLNEGLCGCRREAVDPRLEVLKQLID